MRTLIVRAAIATVLVPVAASAQSLSLTESEALARLSADSPRVLAIRASVDVARADALAAGRWPNPRVAVNRESSAGITEYITTIGQVLPITGRRGLPSARHRREPTASRAALTTRFAACAPISGWRSRTSSPIRAARASFASRSRGSGSCRGDRQARGRGRRRRLRSPSRRARGARRRRGWIGGRRGQGEGPGALDRVLRRLPLPANHRRAAGTKCARPCPRSTSSSHARRRAAASCARFSRRSRALNSPRRPRPAASIPSRRLSPAPNPPVSERRYRRRVRGSRDAAALRSRASPSARARARERRRRAPTRRPSAPRCVPSSAPFARPCLERRQAADRYRAADDANADSNGSRRSATTPASTGILELLDAYRTGSPRVCARSTSTSPRASRNRAGVRQRMGDSVMRPAIGSPASALGALSCACGGNEPGPAVQELPTLDVTSWTDRPSCSWSIRRLSPDGRVASPST